MKYLPLPSQERLQELFDYNSETGDIFRRTAKTYNAQAGSVAGTATKVGYVTIAIDGTRYYAHRIAWALAYGYDPEDALIDHRNRDPSDNRLSNLRLVSNQQNSFNTGAKGVSFKKDISKWRAQIMKDGKCILLGNFDCPLLARIAYLEAKGSLHPIPA